MEPVSLQTTSAWCHPPESWSKSTMNHSESLKSCTFTTVTRNYPNCFEPAVQCDIPLYIQTMLRVQYNYTLSLHNVGWNYLQPPQFQVCPIYWDLYHQAYLEKKEKKNHSKVSTIIRKVPFKILKSETGFQEFTYVCCYSRISSIKSLSLNQEAWADGTRIKNIRSCVLLQLTKQL